MRLGYVSVLDAWRGIAIMLVLVVHCDRVLTGGWLGVHLFLVLSGFLITSLLIDEHRTTGRIALGSFYRRRALRLLPALLAMLAAYLAVMSARDLLGYNVDMTDASLGAAYGTGYVVNIVMAVSDPSSVPYELQHLWSLGVEEQFYVLWPLVVIALFLIPKTGPLPLLFVLVASVFVTGAAFNFTSIAVGCVAGVTYSYGLVRRIPIALATAALAPMAFLVVTIEHDGHATPPILLFTIPTAIVLLACVLSQEWWLPRLVDRRLLRWFGKVSYGLYVWHWPLYVALGWQLGLPAALIVATLSYRYIEQPFLVRKRGSVAERPAYALPTLTPEPARAA